MDKKKILIRKIPPIFIGIIIIEQLKYVGIYMNLNWLNIIAIVG